MLKSISRRSFCIKNGQAGLAYFAGIIILPGILKNLFTGNNDIRQNKKNKIWSVKKELYVSSPEPRVGVSLSMCYIGHGLKREEIQAVIRSSDWVEKPKKRISSDNG